MKDHVGIDHLTKFDAFRLNGGEVKWTLKQLVQNPYQRL